MSRWVVWGLGLASAPEIRNASAAEGDEFAVAYERSETRIGEPRTDEAQS